MAPQAAQLRASPEYELERGGEETGFPYSLIRWEGMEERRPPRNNLFHPIGVAQGYGETGFPSTPARGRVWEGCALPRRTYVHPVRVRRSRMDG